MNKSDKLLILLVAEERIRRNHPFLRIKVKVQIPGSQPALFAPRLCRPVDWSSLIVYQPLYPPRRHVCFLSSSGPS